MHKKIFILAFAITMFLSATYSFGQKGKVEFAAGYGYFSGYSLANSAQNSAPYSNSSGVPVFSLRYYLSRNVTLGMNFGYENISNWASFVTVAPEITLTYFDTRNAPVRLRFYGSASYGVSVLTDNVIGRGEADESGAKPWGGQLAPLGVRWGRQFAMFAEVGYGYKGLFHGGLALRVPRVLHHTKHAD